MEHRGKPKSPVHIVNRVTVEQSVYDRPHPEFQSGRLLQISILTMKSNLLISLHAWAHRQDENFITASFAHLLQRLVEYNPDVGMDVIGKLTNKEVPATGVDANQVRVRTQVTSLFGRPDLEITYPGHRIYVEVKVDSPLGNNQLERYLKDLQSRTSNEQFSLVLLTRYPTEFVKAIEDHVIVKRWFEVAHWLEEYLSHRKIIEPVNQYLAQQFIGLLEYRGMTIEKIGAELITGMAALRNLTAMIELWISGRSRSSAASFGRKWSGFYTPVDAQDFFVGIYHERPDVLVFETYKMPFDTEAAAALGVGEVVRGSGRKWVNELALNSPDNSFFELTREQQIVRLEKFLDESLIAGERLRITDGTP